MRADVHTAPLDEADRALVDYAVDLTTNVASPDASRFDALRTVGFDDAAILRATEVCSYFNFINRMADGLGVVLEG